ncbi:hypothetical protein U0070_005315 [Myodes glareolus]|uniref:Uncharacterized protein n=1 Tax=Myodes glareolus TaxID=447135 RepID=A0AAW0I3D2_MYOGA
MSSVKPLVYAVIRFLREQSQMDAYTSDEQESLEVDIIVISIDIIVISIDIIMISIDTIVISIDIIVISIDIIVMKEFNDMVPLSNSVPEDVGKADQLKDEGKYCPQAYFLPLWRQQL